MQQLQRECRSFGRELPSTLHIEPFQAANFNGVRITGKMPGTLSLVVVSVKAMSVIFSLVEGGAIGGAEASSFPTAREDEQVFPQILDTLKVSSR